MCTSHGKYIVSSKGHTKAVGYNIMKGTCLAMCCNYTPYLSHFTGSDYNDTNITLTISASSTIRRVNHVIEIFYDNINEKLCNCGRDWTRCQR